MLLSDPGRNVASEMAEQCLITTMIGDVNESLFLSYESDNVQFSGAKHTVAFRETMPEAFAESRPVFRVRRNASLAVAFA